MKRLVYILIFMGLMHSCSESPYEGYTLSKTGMNYKIHVIGDGDVPGQAGDFVLPSMILSDTLDSVIYTNLMEAGDPFVYKLTKLKNGGLNEALSLLNEGDSASFIIEGTRINLDKLCKIEGLNGVIHPVKLSIKMNEILTPTEIDSLKKLESWLKDEEMNEQIRLNNFLKENKITEDYRLEGIYYLPIDTGKGRIAAGGSNIRVHYKAFFVDGTVFDNTYEYSNALEVDLGKPDQLLEGFELGIRQMREGGKARFIIPSQLSFGERGSSTGIVAPYTTLVYEVELLSVSPY